MAIEKSIIKNSIFLFIARLSNPAATIAIGLYIAKTMEVKSFGQYTFILSYCFLFAILFSLGLSTLISRDTANNRDEIGKYFSNTSLIGIVSGFIGLIVMIAASYSFKLSDESRMALMVYSFSTIPSILIFIWESLLNTFGNNKYVALVQIVEAFVKISISYFILSRSYGIIALMMVFLGSRLLCLLLYYIIIKSIFKPLHLQIKTVFIKETLSLVPTFAGLYIFSVLLSKTDLIMLALFKDFNDVGIYSAAYKLLEIAFMLPTCVITVLFPVLVRFAQNSFDNFKKISYIAIFYSTILLLPIVIAAIFFADKIIIIVYSKEFSKAILPFQILITTLGVYMIDQVFAHSLIANNLQKLNLRALMMATAFNIILNIILIPKYSYLGSSIATLAATLFMASVHFYFINKYLYRFNFIKLLTCSIPQLVKD